MANIWVRISTADVVVVTPLFCSDAQKSFSSVSSVSSFKVGLPGVSISDDISSAVQEKVMQQYGMMIKSRRVESDGHSDCWNAQNSELEVHQKYEGWSCCCKNSCNEASRIFMWDIKRWSIWWQFLVPGRDIIMIKSSDSFLEWHNSAVQYEHAH